MSGAGHEFGFELRVCRWAERAWPPDGDTADPDAPGTASDPDEAPSDGCGSSSSAGRGAVVVARQLGTRQRRWDTIVVESTPADLEARGAFGDKALDADLLRVVRHAPSEWRWYRAALPEPDYPWRYVRDAVHRAGDRGVVETRKRGGRVELRRKWRYPDWVDRLVAVENKPDLTASAARDLAAQVQRDVDRGLADEVWVATRATDADVEPVLLERLPVEAGILAVDPASGSVEVVWHPRSLDSGDGGASAEEEKKEKGKGEEGEEETADRRLEITERAYGRGWRSYVETMRPDCRHFGLRELDFPYCGAKEREPRPAECSGSCPYFEPEPPAWRQHGWPIEGGPGSAATRLLDRRRSRHR